MHKSVALFAVILLTACGGGARQTTSSAPTPTGPAAAVQSNLYQGVGVVKRINLKAPAVEIDHQDIEGLMPAMQMEFPVTDAAMLNGLAVNDHIEFTIDNTANQMKVTAIKKR